jgi:hypothetical protein
MQNRFRSLALLTCLISIAGALDVHAGELDIYEHNGSVIHWFVVNDEVTATYDQPKPSLLRSGIHDGSVLFKGFEEGRRVTGTAFVFRRGCSPAPYNVVGYFEGDRIVLSGPAPVRSEGGCDVIRYSLDSQNSKLVFRFAGKHN